MSRSVRRRKPRRTYKTQRNVQKTRWYVNGFPKAGTHMLAKLLEPLAPAMRATEDLNFSSYVTSFKGDGWSTKWHSKAALIYRLSQIHPGRFMLGHLGFHQDIERSMFYNGICHIFVYRDFRDIAVSMAHHIMSKDEERFRHRARDIYLAKGGFDEVLSACINGIKEYAGVMDRWAYYAPWLNVGWVFKARYEQVRLDPAGCANAMIRYAHDRLGAICGRQYDYNPDGLVPRMVASMGQRHKSATFRKGSIGDWTEHFTERHKEEFKASDKNGWLVKLGYEKDNNW